MMYTMTTGAALRNAREEMGFTLKQAADALQIPAKFLEAVEKSNFEALPARVYACGFVKKYADYLKLPSADAVKEFEREWDEAVTEADGQVKAAPPRKTRTAIFDRRRIMLSFFVILFAAVGTYFLYGLRFVISAPKLVIESPGEDIATSEDTLVFRGIVEKESDLTLNGRVIHADEGGEFEDTVILLPGLNVFEFEAVNRVGKVNKVIRYILVE